MRSLIFLYVFSAAGPATGYINHRTIQIRNVGIDSHIQVRDSYGFLQSLSPRTGYTSGSLTGHPIAPPKTVFSPSSEQSTKSRQSRSPSPSNQNKALQKSSSNTSPSTSPRTSQERDHKRKEMSTTPDGSRGRSPSPMSVGAGSPHGPGAAMFLNDLKRLQRSQSKSQTLADEVKYSMGLLALPRQDSNKGMYDVYNTFRSDSPGPIGLKSPKISAGDIRAIGLQPSSDIKSRPSSRTPSPAHSSSRSRSHSPAPAPLQSPIRLGSPSSSAGMPYSPSSPPDAHNEVAQPSSSPKRRGLPAVKISAQDLRDVGLRPGNGFS